MRIPVALIAVTTLSAIAAAQSGWAAEQATTMSLAGQWRFTLDAAHEGIRNEFFQRDLSGSIRLPGSTDAAKLGTRNANPPTLDGLYRIYTYEGPAWYQRDIFILAAWTSKQITLLLERTHWDTQVWVDGTCFGLQDSLIAPHVYNLGTLAPGKHRLTIMADNTKKIDLGRFVSINYEGTQTNWNGLIGKLELRAQDPVSMVDVQVYPDIGRKVARVRVAIANATGAAAGGALTIDAVSKQSGEKIPARTVRFTAGEKKTIVDAELPMGSQVKLWDEFSPNLYELTVKMSAKSATASFSDHSSITFGMREIGTRGTQLTLNGRAIFIRGTLECAIFPLTGYPPTNVEAWRRIYRQIKSYGLNAMRFHSWTPPDAAFAAADLEGIMIQTEGPMANVATGQDVARDVFMEQELLRIVRTYGNHPSFCLMTPGNEFGGSLPLLTHWVDMLRKEDARHLYSSASNNTTLAPNRQFTVTARPRGVKGPDTDHDFRDVISQQDRPYIGHEIGQWTFLPDFREMKKYSGVLAPRNFELYREDLARRHMLDLAPKFVEASGRFAVLLYKEEMEVLLRTPGHAGYELLDLHDYPGQGTALIGILDPFWDSKGFVTPEVHRQYCGQTVPLLRMKKRSFTTDETFTAEVDIAHFGANDLTNVRPIWSIRDTKSREVASGELAAIALPTGKLTSAGKFTASFANAIGASKLIARVALKGTAFANQWDIWVYPPDKAVLNPAGVEITHEWNEESKRSLLAGGRVLLFPDTIEPSHSLAGSFLPVFWSPVWFPNRMPATMSILCDPTHPALAQFPTEFHTNWQWYELLQNSRSVILDDAPAAFRPIVQVIDNLARNHKLANLFEARVGKGSLLVCTISLQVSAEREPAARQLLRSLYAYAGSAAFHPAQALIPELLDKLFQAPTK